MEEQSRLSEKRTYVRKAAFGAGCFWHVQDIFSNTNGVVKVTSGYMGGKEEEFPQPTYEKVCTGKTGYIEVVLVEYDPYVLSYEDLLKIFWDMHEPTSLDKQSGDAGTQYKSVIFYYDYEQKSSAEKSKSQLQNTLNKEIVTEILPAKNFFKAEERHQDFLKKKKANCGV